MASVLQIGALFECVDILEGIKKRGQPKTATFAANRKSASANSERPTTRN
jgi:hypothetical protein